MLRPIEIRVIQGNFDKDLISSSHCVWNQTECHSSKAQLSVKFDQDGKVLLETSDLSKATLEAQRKQG